jgi:uncharacterized protein YjbJ (UPF0337 family)
MNANTVEGKWKEIKGEVQKAWGKLTDDELEQTKGEMKAVGGLIQQKYGENQDHYGKKLSDIYKDFKLNRDQPTTATNN